MQLPRVILSCYKFVFINMVTMVTMVRLMYTYIDILHISFALFFNFDLTTLILVLSFIINTLYKKYNVGRYNFNEI